MDDAKRLANAVLDLTRAGGAKRTKAGQLRELLPVIEEAQNKGVSHEEILRTLNYGGLNLKMGAYTTMLWRARSGKTKRDAKEQKEVSRANAATVSTPRKEPEPEIPVQSASEEVGEKSAALEAQERREQRSRQFIGDGSNPLLKNRMKGTSK